MNGRLHLGHCFTLAKVEFAVSWERMRGKRCLWPFAFHCTGMPIKACADKLAYEMATFGNPPVFPVEPTATAAAAPADEAADSTPVSAGSTPAAGAAPGGRKPKSKEITKGTANKKWQWDIMLSMGIAAEDIPKFANPAHWITFFPAYCQEDLVVFGAKVDWRRSFYTTDLNPYYDAFIRWQFNELKRLNKIKYGKRPSIYSPKDGQPCMDHDRASGEGVGMTEYTNIKLRMLEPLPAALAGLAGQAVFLVAGTLRPETMYGQTNCWAHPDVDYGAFRYDESTIVVCTARAARNMAFQFEDRPFPASGMLEQLAAFKGQAIMGARLSAPLALYPIVYVLPMLTVKANKGTGIVTSVPSDAPMDYRALADLKAKPALREKYGITDEMVMPFEPVPIIDVPSIGNLCAPIVCEQMKIKSQNDTAALEEAKDVCYLKGFNEGVFIVPDWAGMRVQDAKPLIRTRMLEAGEAIKYWEPESEIISRSGDECVVAAVDQWYLCYQDAEWKSKVAENIALLNTYHPETRAAFTAKLGELHEWACSRSFGLGTRIPWDTQFLIESLSDSTIYMAFYTIAHLLAGDIGGRTPGPLGIRADQCTDAFFNTLFRGEPYTAELGVPRAAMDALRKEFAYFYPVDLRVSGKDLVGNHLLFMMYNHTALFGANAELGKPDERWAWPRAIRANGHLQLNGEKMSKGTGNFLSMRQACEQYSSDACRLALGESGDTVDADANFEESGANKAILRLTTFVNWVADIMSGKIVMREGPSEQQAFFDSVFESTMNQLLAQTQAAFDEMRYRDAVKFGWHEFQAARDVYREAIGSDENMSRPLIMRFIELQTLAVLPFTPHTAEHIWTQLLAKPRSIMHARFPQPGPVDTVVLQRLAFVRSVVHELCKAVDKLRKRANDITSAIIYYAPEFLPWQKAALRVLREVHASAGGNMDGAVDALKANDEVKRNMKLAMPFAMQFVASIKEQGVGVLVDTPPFDEGAIMRQVIGYIQSTSNVADVRIYATTDANIEIPAKSTAHTRAMPGYPTIHVNTSSS